MTKRVLEQIPSKGKNELYAKDSKANYATYVDNTKSFEILSKKLIDNLKVKIEKEEKEFDSI